MQRSDQESFEQHILLVFVFVLSAKIPEFLQRIPGTLQPSGNEKNIFCENYPKLVVGNVHHYVQIMLTISPPHPSTRLKIKIIK